MNARPPQAGVTLVELMVTLVVIAILVAVGVPAFVTWTADFRVRACSEALLSALRLTQSTAVARSRVGVFALTSSTPAYNAAASTDGGNWFAILLPMNGGLSDETAAGMGTILTAKAATQYNASIAGQATVCFSGLGRVVSQTSAATGLGASCPAPNTDGTPFAYVVSATKAVRKYKVLVYPNGRIRMCDALKTLSTTVPDGCP